MAFRDFNVYLFVLGVLFIVAKYSEGFAPASRAARMRPVERITKMMAQDPFKRITNAISNAANTASEEVKGGASGALIGGLVLGPLGAFLGAQIGSSMGANSETANEKRLAEELGVSVDTIKTARKLSSELQSAQETYQFVKDVADRNDRRVREAERDYAEQYEKAKQLLIDGDENGARVCLESRQALKLQLDKYLADQLDSVARLEKMDRLLNALRSQANELEELLQRAQMNKLDNSLDRSTERIDGISTPFPTVEDPLEARFRALERDKNNLN